MVKKTLLSMAIAATVVGLAGCNVSSTDKYDNKITDNAPSTQEMPKENGVAPVFDPANSLVPTGIDFLYANTTDGTVNTKVSEKTFPVTTAMNQLAGFSTVAPIYVNIKGAMNPASLVAGDSVFLLKLKNKVGDTPVDAADITKLLGAVGALTESGPNPEKFADAFDFTAQPVAGTDYSVDQVVLDNDGSPLPSIRITLDKPLEARTKYIVVVTNKVTDDSGEGLVPPSHYELARGNQVLPSKALEGVRSLVKLWDGLSKTYLIGTGELDPNSGQDVVFSYAFTTDDALDTLVSYAAPELFVQKNLSLEEAEDLADKAQGQEPGTKIAARKATYDAMGGETAGLPAAPQGYFAPAVTDNLEGTRTSTAYQAGLYSTIAQTNLKDLFEVDANIRQIAASPTSRTVKLIPSGVSDAVLDAAAQDPNYSGPTNTSPAGLGLGTSAEARLIQGYIELPKFLEPATKTTLVSDPKELKQNVVVALREDSRWQASSSAGALLTKVKNDGNTYPPMDNDGKTTNVTYRFPFPQQIGTNKVPMLVAVPDPGCATPYPVVMYVHGITGSRANVLPMASSMADSTNCAVTVAIDLPEHGVAPQTKGPTGELVDNSVMPFNLEVDSGLWSMIIANAPEALLSTEDKAAFAEVKERHNGVYGSLARQAINYEEGLGDSGSTFINMQNFGRTRDNLRQAVVDLLNVNASLKAIDAQLGGTEDDPKLDYTKVGVVGHSLGGMVASAFVAVNNQAAELNKNLTPIKTLTLANTGSHLTKLLENSPAFAPEIVGVPESNPGAGDGTGLEGNGVSQGSVTFETFLSIFQANVEAVDPVASLSRVTIPVTTITAAGDNTVPNSDYFSDASNPFLQGLQGAGKLSNDWNVTTAKAPLAGAQGIPELNSVADVTLSAGSGHSTFAKPESDQQTEVGGVWASIISELNN